MDPRLHRQLSRLQRGDVQNHRPGEQHRYSSPDVKGVTSLTPIKPLTFTNTSMWTSRVDIPIVCLSLRLTSLLSLPGLLSTDSKP
jgi:hypothetical protein